MVYLFDKSRDIANRKNQLVDREADKRIEKAREFVDSLHDYFLTMDKIANILLENTEASIIIKEIIAIIGKDEKLSSAFERIEKQALAVISLNDYELTSLSEQVLSFFFPHAKYLQDLALGILHGTRTTINRMELEIHQMIFTDALSIIVKMTKRLDELAEPSNKKSPV